MPKSDQGVTPDRYSLIPRTAIFLRRGDEYLLIKGSPAKRLWSGKYNGLGGHVERGENVLEAANRELAEETGLMADLWLCGTVVVDAGDPHRGVCLFVFCGENPQGEIKASTEGVAEWVPIVTLESVPVVEDLPALMEKIHAMKKGSAPFSARSHYGAHEKIIIEFEE